MVSQCFRYLQGGDAESKQPLQTLPVTTRSQSSFKNTSMTRTKGKQLEPSDCKCNPATTAVPQLTRQNRTSKKTKTMEDERFFFFYNPKNPELCHVLCPPWIHSHLPEEENACLYWASVPWPSLCGATRSLAAVI